MKKISLLFVIFLFYMTSNLFATPMSEHWKLIDSLVHHGMARSASSELSKLLEQLSTDNPERIKAYMLLGSLNAEGGNEGWDAMILQVKKERNQAITPMRNLYDLLLANLYTVYARKNGTLSHSRKDNSDPFLPTRDWSMQRFKDSINTLYKSALSPELKKYKSQDYISISSSEHLTGTPTLYELVGNAVLDQMLILFGDQHIATTIFNTVKETNDPDSEAVALFQYRELEVSNKDYSPWVTELQNILNRIKGKPLYSDLLYNLAYVHYANDQHAIADSIAHEIMHAFPNSKNAEYAKALSDVINMPQMEIITGQHDPYPGKSWFLNLAALNVKQACFCIFPCTPDQYLNEDDLQVVKQQTPITSWEQQFPADKLNTPHTYRCAMPALPQGCYLLMLETNKQKDTIRNYMYFQVSALAYNTSHSLCVIDKMNGKELNNTILTRYQKNFSKLKEHIHCNETGFFNGDSIPTPGEYVCFTSGENRLWARFKPGSYSSSTTNATLRDFEVGNTNILFTDRHLYRPGQRIQFKGIAFKENPDHTYSVCKNSKRFIHMEIPDRTTVSQDYTTNNFGSFYGYFDIPEDVPSGTSIALGTYPNITFVRVEDYTLPSTEIILHSTEHDSESADQIVLKGQVATLTGVNTGGSKITYLINKLQHTLITDSKGFFTIKIPYTPQFDLHISATTPEGDTCTFHRFFMLPEQSLFMEFNTPETQSTRQPLSILVKFTNNDHNIIEHPFQLKIERLIKKNIWFADMIDTTLVPVNKFREMAPRTSYHPHEEIFSHQQTVLDSLFSSSKQMGKALETLNLEQGHYRITVSATDRKSRQLSKSKLIKVIDPHHHEPLNEHFYYLNENKTYHPGDTVCITLGSACEEMHLYLFKLNRTRSEHFSITLNHDQKTLKLPVRNEDRGNYILNITGAGDGKTIQESIHVSVDYQEELLNIELTSYRHKVCSGEKEKLFVKVTDNKGKGVPCEILAYMYDQSLDRLASHEYVYRFVPYPHISFNEYATMSASTLGHARKDKTLVSHYYFPPHFPEYTSITYGFHTAKIREFLLQKICNPSRSFYCKMPHKTNKRYQSDEAPGMLEKLEIKEQENIYMQENSQETAFFYPFIRTNQKGIAKFEYTTPASQSHWRLNLIAHSPQMGIGNSNYLITVYKKVKATLTDHLIQGDSVQLTASISNYTENEINVDTRIELFSQDLRTGEYIPLAPSDIHSTQLETNNSLRITSSSKIPEGCTHLICRIFAITESHIDVEEQIIPLVDKIKNERTDVLQQFTTPVNADN